MLISFLSIHGPFNSGLPKVPTWTEIIENYKKLSTVNDGLLANFQKSITGVVISIVQPREQALIQAP